MEKDKYIYKNQNNTQLNQEHMAVLKIHKNMHIYIHIQITLETLKSHELP